MRHSGFYPPKDKFRIVFLETNLTELGAFAIERRYIRWYGRKDLGTGILHNKTDGGEGGSGAIKSEETRKKMSVAKSGDKHPRGMLGKKNNDATLKKKSLSMQGKNKGKIYGKQTEEQIEHRIATLRGKSRPVTECPHCRKIGGEPQMIQWHFDKCKYK